MGIEQFLTSEDKIASLEALIKMMSMELYTLSLKAGLDPEEVDFENFSITPGDLQRPHLVDIEFKSRAFVAAKNKLEELKNA